VIYSIRIAAVDIRNLRVNIIAMSVLTKERQKNVTVAARKFGEIMHGMKIRVYIFVKNANGSVATRRTAKTND
jgi:predicted component of type VI protein secretion system